MKGLVVLQGPLPHRSPDSQRPPGLNIQYYSQCNDIAANTEILQPIRDIAAKYSDIAARYSDIAARYSDIAVLLHGMDPYIA